MHYKTLTTTVAILALSASSIAQAATLGSVSGSVLVNQGNGFVAAKVGALQAGDTIMSRKDGNAVIAYDGGCTVKVAPGSVVTVAAKSPCAQLAGKVAGTHNSDLPAGAGGGAPAGYGAAGAGSAGLFGTGLSGTALAIGAVVIVGAAAAGIAIANSDDNKATIVPVKPSP